MAMTIRNSAKSAWEEKYFSPLSIHSSPSRRAAQVKRLRPDAVLLDIGLPALDGYLVAEHIRALPENGDTMIVAVSGYGQEQDQLRSKSVGFDYHVVKPIDPMVLAGLVGSLRMSRDGTRSAPAPGAPDPAA